MTERGIANLDDQFAITHYILERFNDILGTLASQHDRFVHVRSIGTLASPEDWGDELHPTSPGFAQIAARLKPELRRLLPNTPIR